MVTDADLNAYSDLATNFAVRVAATLRIADLVAGGTNSIEGLAAAVGVDPGALGRLLHYLAARGVFEETSSGVFALNAVARRLESSHESGLRSRLDLDGLGGSLALPFTRLLDAVRTGEPAYPLVFGLPFWERLNADPGLARAFHAMMGGPPQPDSWAGAVASYHWSSIRHVVDVGGGQGAFVAAVLRRHPGLRATLVELPSAIAAARPQLEATGVAGRCSLVEQSFFDPLPAGGDVYFLRFVIHDWNDRDAARILRGCADGAGEAGRVLVSERIRGGSDDVDTTAHDLLMLVSVGGRERTLEEFHALARTAGLRITTTVKSTGPWLLEMAP